MKREAHQPGFLSGVSGKMEAIGRSGFAFTARQTSYLPRCWKWGAASGCLSNHHAREVVISESKSNTRPMQTRRLFGRK